MPQLKPLVIIPTYLSQETHVTILGDCLASIRKTVSDSVDILCVDDHSPEPDAVDAVVSRYDRYDFEMVRQPTNEGFSRTVNVGLRRARDEGREAVLMNADIEMLTPGWMKHCRKTTAPDGEKAGVVGGLLLFPNGLIQHAGVYMSLLTRGFDHIFKYGPANLPEALEKRVCPVTGAFQYIRPEVLEKTGLYDEDFRMGFEDVDFCIRVFKDGFAIVYNPNIRAYHFESLFRGNSSGKLKKWQHESLVRLIEKWSEQNFAGLVPNYW